MYCGCNRYTNENGLPGVPIERPGKLGGIFSGIIGKKRKMRE
jgi:hypothetical protein